MPIPFTCPHCGLDTQVADQYAGQQGPCAGCGQTITIPGGPARPDGNGSATTPRSSGWSTPVILAVLAAALLSSVFVIGILVALLFPAVTAARSAARRANCVTNLQQISVAMEAYRSAHGQYPPPYTVDRDGQKMHSWRVLLLPYLGEEAKMVYEMYDLNQPWDSPQNQVVATMVPAIYVCPEGSPNQALGETSYCLVVGEGLLFEPDGAVDAIELSRGDGAAQTLMIVEAAGAGINWIEPKDLTLQGLMQGVNSGMAGCCQSNHPGGANVVMADNSVRFVSDSVSPEELKAMATVSGGEITPTESY